MFALKPGMRPVPASALRVVALASALTVAGCASQSGTHATSNAPSARVAGYASVGVEDDGLPSQAPPPSRIRDLPDDASEPYSRNYGGSGRTAVWQASPEQVMDHKAAPAIPDDLPPAFRRKLAAAMAVNE